MQDEADTASMSPDLRDMWSGGECGLDSCAALGLGELRKVFKRPQSKGKLAESEADQRNLSRGTWAVEFREASYCRKSWVFLNHDFLVL